MINKEKNKLIQITLDKEIVQALEDICWESHKKLGVNINKSDIITTALIAYFEKANVIFENIKDRKYEQLKK